MRTAQVWHLRYQDVFLQPSVVTVLRERAFNFARHRKVRSPGRRVQVVDIMQDPGPPPPTDYGQSKHRPPGLEPAEIFGHNHPDIRPGEALVPKTQGGQVTYWAQSKMASGVEQWRQLSDMPPPKPGGAGGGKRGRPAGQGILSPVPRKGVAFEDTGRPLPANRAESAAALPAAAVHDGGLSPTATYLPKIEHSIQQRRMQHIRCGMM